MTAWESVRIADMLKKHLLETFGAVWTLAFRERTPP